MQNERNCYERKQKMFESRIYAGAKPSRKDGHVVLRHGRTCSEMSQEILRIGEQKDRAAVQSFKSLSG